MEAVFLSPTISIRSLSCIPKSSITSIITSFTCPLSLVNICGTFSITNALGFNNLILVTSTYGCGDLQGDWEDKIDSFNEADFKDKTIALVGIGDSDTYSDTFCDSLSYLYEKAKGGNVIGKTSPEGYDFSDSKAILDSGEFMGLVLDYDNQEELNEQRISNWVKDITPLFS